MLKKVLKDTEKGPEILCAEMIAKKLQSNLVERITVECELSSINISLKLISRYEDALSRYLGKKGFYRCINIVCLMLTISLIVLAIVIPPNLTATPYLCNYLVLAYGAVVDVWFQNMFGLDYLKAKNSFNKFDDEIGDLVQDKENLQAREAELQSKLTKLESEMEKYEGQLDFIRHYDDILAQIKKENPNAFIDQALLNSTKREDLLEMFNDYINEYVSPQDISLEVPKDVKKITLTKKN